MLPSATSGKTSAILKERPGFVSGTVRQVTSAGVRHSPFSVNLLGCQGSGHGSDDGAQDSRHAVQVMDPAGVLDL